MLQIKSNFKEIEINDVVYKVRVPTYGNSLEYDKKLKECGDDNLLKTQCLFDYLETLGIPKDIVIQLEISHVVQIFEYLTGEKKS